MHSEPEIVFKSAFDVIGLPFTGTNDEGAFTDLWQKFQSRHTEIPFWTQAQAAYGVIKHFDPQKGVLTYLTGLDVPHQAKAPRGMEKWHIPAHAYAIFPCTLPTLMETVAYIYKTWLLTSPYKRADGPEFERYPLDFDPVHPQAALLFYIPIEERSAK
ncbi:MAG: hypothetical protein Fur0018_27410 [Anaerolineales bacterium]